VNRKKNVERRKEFPFIKPGLNIGGRRVSKARTTIPKERKGVFLRQCWKRDPSFKK